MCMEGLSEQKGIWFTSEQCVGTWCCGSWAGRAARWRKYSIVYNHLYLQVTLGCYLQVTIL